MYRNQRKALNRILGLMLMYSVIDFFGNVRDKCCKPHMVLVDVQLVTELVPWPGLCPWRRMIISSLECDSCSDLSDVLAMTSIVKGPES